MAESLVSITDSIRAKYDASPEWQAIRSKAYPTKADTVKKVTKKVKNIKISRDEFPKEEPAKGEAE